jgi:hypothetical protein
MKIEVSENEVIRSAELLAMAMEMENLLTKGTGEFVLRVSRHDGSSKPERYVARGKTIYGDYNNPLNAEVAVAELARETARKFLADAAAIYRKHMPIPVTVEEKGKK